MSIQPPQSSQIDIGSISVDPNAELVAPSPSRVTGQQEVDFYRQSGTQYDLLHNQQNLGFLGKFFGANSAAPTNIAGLVIFCSFAILVTSVFFAPANAELAEARQWLVGLITSAMSFIFGAATKK